MAIARRFVLTNASRVKNYDKKSKKDYDERQTFDKKYARVREVSPLRVGTDNYNIEKSDLLVCACIDDVSSVQTMMSRR